ncbi:hypothetical protein CB1_000535011 [Camelus ferus]|nr:hypothetical protein CB1_000535011 [Camelus ferus]
MANSTELIDLSTVDVILISNYHCMMALPYITEHTGFTGTVYATEPTVQIGRLLMEELVNFIERVPKAQSASLWKNKDTQRSGGPAWPQLLARVSGWVSRGPFVAI